MAEETIAEIRKDSNWILRVNLVERFEDRFTIDIRLYFDNGRGAPRRTDKGIALGEKRLDMVLDAIGQAREKMKKYREERGNLLAQKGKDNVEC